MLMKLISILEYKVGINYFRTCYFWACWNSNKLRSKIAPAVLCRRFVLDHNLCPPTALHKKNTKEMSAEKGIKTMSTTCSAGELLVFFMIFIVPRRVFPGRNMSTYMYDCVRLYPEAHFFRAAIYMIYRLMHTSVEWINPLTSTSCWL